MGEVSVNSMISRFIASEMERIYKRFNSIPDREKAMVASFVELTGSREFCQDFDPYRDYETTRVIAEALDGEDNLEVVSRYLFLRLKAGMEAERDEARKVQSDLERLGYGRFRGYHFYHRQREDLMLEIAEEELSGRLDDCYAVSDMFSHDELAEMWVDGTSKTDAARIYLRENDWWDIIDCTEPEESYTDSKGNRVMFCFDGGGF